MMNGPTLPHTVMTYECFIAANKPDIVIVYRSACQAIIVDMTVSYDDNLVKGEK